MILGVGYTPFLMRFRLIFSVLGVGIPVGGGTSMVNEWRSRASPSGLIRRWIMVIWLRLKRGSANTHISERALRAGNCFLKRFSFSKTKNLEKSRPKTIFYFYF